MKDTIVFKNQTKANNHKLFHQKCQNTLKKNQK